MSESPLRGQVAIITGASSGIGAAVARDLDAAGVQLVLSARRAERLRELAEGLHAARSVPGDVLEPDLPQKLIDAALEAFGRCDVVFNNAGVMEVGTVEEIDVERLCQMARINVEAVYRMAYVALKHFRQKGHGHLINTSSVLGTKVRPTTGAYAGTKYAIEALSEALRMELAGSGVKVSCIQPALTQTELHDHWKVHPAQTFGIAHPLRPEDIARCVRFVLEQPAHVLIPKMMAMPAEQAI